MTRARIDSNILSIVKQPNLGSRLWILKISAYVLFFRGAIAQFIEVAIFL